MNVYKFLAVVLALLSALGMVGILALGFIFLGWVMSLVVSVFGLSISVWQGGLISIMLILVMNFVALHKVDE